MEEIIKGEEREWTRWRVWPEIMITSENGQKPQCFTQKKDNKEVYLLMPLLEKNHLFGLITFVSIKLLLLLCKNLAIFTAIYWCF